MIRVFEIIKHTFILHILWSLRNSRTFSGRRKNISRTVNLTQSWLNCYENVCVYFCTSYIFCLPPHPGRQGKSNSPKVPSVLERKKFLNFQEFQEKEQIRSLFPSMKYSIFSLIPGETIFSLRARSIRTARAKGLSVARLLGITFAKQS